MPSPTCTVNATATTSGVDVAASSTPTIALVSASGVSVWSIECIGCDEANSVATINASLSVNQVAKTATFTAPSALGSAVIFRSRVNQGIDVNGNAQDSYTTTFKVAVLTAGNDRVGALNETTENGTGGWAAIVNKIIRKGAGPVRTSTSTTPYAVVAADEYIRIDSSAGAKEVDLPASPALGRTICIKRNGANNVTIDGNGKNIDGAATLVLSANYQTACMTYGGTEWELL